MCPKLQPSSLENDGQNSGVREKSHNSIHQIARGHAGSERHASVPEDRLEKSSTGNSKYEKSPESGASDAAQNANVETPHAASLQACCQPLNSESPDQSPGRGRPTVRNSNVPSPELPHGEVVPRCEVARSAGYDPTSERAVACGAAAEVVCEYCGPMCAACAQDTFCYYGEHKLTQLPDDGPLPPSRKRRRPVNEVVYVELKCPNCKRVRLALPKKHHPQRIRKCPVCKMKVPAEYLAHGFTRRRLPYYEVFTTEKELPEGVEFKRRMPWDRRPNWWVEE